jgi:hypothetical protein
MKVEFSRGYVKSQELEVESFVIPRIGDRIVLPDLPTRYEKEQKWPFDGVVEEVRLYYTSNLSLELVEVRVA